MNEAAEQKIVQHLYEAHGAELMLAHTLTAHIAITPQGDYRDGLERHLRETRDHARRIQEHLASRGHDRGVLQAGYGLAQGAVGQALAFSMLPWDLLRGMSGEEKLLKNARDEMATEAMEIAAYLAIEELAKAVGDTETARLAASIRADEERMLTRLQELVPRLAGDVIRAEVEGRPRYDLRHIGAVDVARTLAGSAARSVTRSVSRTGRRVERSTETKGATRSPSPRTRSQERTSSGSSSLATPGSSSKRASTSKTTSTSKSTSKPKAKAATKRATTTRSRSTSKSRTAAKARA